MQVVPRSELRRLEAEAVQARAQAETVAGESAQLRVELMAAQTTIATLMGEITGLTTLGDNLQKLMAELKARLGTNSGHSTKPPSSDGPAVPKRPGSKPTGRRRGEQPGHMGKNRALVASEDADEA